LAPTLLQCLFTCRAAIIACAFHSHHFTFLGQERWRSLRGSDPSPVELAGKIRVLEERLNDKQEQVLQHNQQHHKALLRLQLVDVWCNLRLRLVNVWCNLRLQLVNVWYSLRLQLVNVWYSLR
jgi:hypothetical protein